MLPDWKNRKDVENRDYRHLSQCEIGGGKRISRHLSGELPVRAQTLFSDHPTRQHLELLLDAWPAPFGNFSRSAPALSEVR
jgi:hypothetical protein